MTRQSLIVARREFLERVRNKWFAIVTILGPLGMIAALVIPAYLQIKNMREGINIQVVDKSGRDIGARMDNPGATSLGFHIANVPSDTAVARLEERIAAEEIDGYLELPADILAGGTAVYYGDNAANPMIETGLAKIVDSAVFRTRGEDLGLSDLAILTMFKPVEFEAKQTTGEGDVASGKASFVIGYAILFVLYISILIYGVAVLRSVLQEKSNRVVEIVISSIKPLPLMLGKVIGVGGVGLLQLSIWGAMAVGIVYFREPILGVFGVGEAAAAIVIPELGGDVLFVVLAYFLFGYFFYASLYAAVGAMVNSEQEAQQAQTPIMLLLMIPVFCVQVVAGDPRGGIAEVLTQNPFTSPILMPMRYILGGASGMDVVLSLLILLVSLLAAVFVAAKIYRIGILSYGKKPTLRELWRWVNM